METGDRKQLIGNEELIEGTEMEAGGGTVKKIMYLMGDKRGIEVI